MKKITNLDILSVFIENAKKYPNDYKLEYKEIVYKDFRTYNDYRVKYESENDLVFNGVIRLERHNKSIKIKGHIKAYQYGQLDYNLMLNRFANLGAIISIINY